MNKLKVWHLKKYTHHRRTIDANGDVVAVGLLPAVTILALTGIGIFMLFAGHPWLTVLAFVLIKVVSKAPSAQAVADHDAERRISERGAK